MGVNCSAEDLRFQSDIQKFKREDVFHYYRLSKSSHFRIVVNNGKYSKCYRKTDSARFLMKRVSKKNDQLGPEDLFDIKYIHCFNHPNLIKPVEYFQDDDAYQILFEQPQGKNLRLMIKDGDYFFKSSQIAHIASQLFSLLNQFHNEKFIHRNLNPDIFFFSKRNLKITLVDINSMCKLKLTKTKCPTNLLYSSPEMAQFGVYYDHRTDIYSLGVIFQTLVFGIGPYDCNQNINSEDLRHKVVACHQREIDRLTKMEKASEYQFVQKFMQPNIDDRITLIDAMKDDFIQENQDFGTIDRNNAVLNRLINFRIHYLFSFQIGSLIEVQDTDDIDSVFLIIDSDRSGQIDREELTEIFNSFIRSDMVNEMIENIFSTIDIDGNDMIDQNEFVALVYSFDVKKHHVLPSLFRRLRIAKDLTCSFIDMMEAFGVKNKIIIEAAFRQLQLTKFVLNNQNHLVNSFHNTRLQIVPFLEILLQNSYEQDWKKQAWFEDILTESLGQNFELKTEDLEQWKDILNSSKVIARLTSKDFEEKEEEDNQEEEEVEEVVVEADQSVITEQEGEDVEEWRQATFRRSLERRDSETMDLDEETFKKMRVTFLPGKNWLQLKEDEDEHEEMESQEGVEAE